MSLGAKGWLGMAAGLSVAALSGAVAYGRFAVSRDVKLPDAVPGERRTLDGRAGRLSYYVAGTGAPLLLVHSINAAASTYEVAPLFERLRTDRRVYSVDLPGFGFSDRSPRDYAIGLYVDALADMLDMITSETGAPRLDALAVSLSSEFLARLAARRPEGFRTLALVTPTGFDRRSASRRGGEGATREVPGLRAGLDVPLWGRGLYNLLVTRPSIRFFLEKTWGSKRIDEGAFEYAYLTSHQPGAEHAPFAFVSGRLFGADIRAVYERLAMPVLLLHGTKGDFSDFSAIGWTADRPNWRVVAMPTGALPQFERPDEVEAVYRGFLNAAG